MKKILSLLVAIMIFAALLPSAVLAENYVGKWYGVAVTGTNDNFTLKKCVIY